MAALEIAPPAVRTAVSRMVSQGWLEPIELDGASSYRLTPRAERRLREAATRIYRTDMTPWDGHWHLLSLEHVADRASRDRLRNGLTLPRLRAAARRHLDQPARVGRGRLAHRGRARLGAALHSALRRGRRRAHRGRHGTSPRSAPRTRGGSPTRATWSPRSTRRCREPPTDATDQRAFAARSTPGARVAEVSVPRPGPPPRPAASDVAGRRGRGVLRRAGEPPAAGRGTVR